MLLESSCPCLLLTAATIQVGMNAAISEIRVKTCWPSSVKIFLVALIHTNAFFHVDLFFFCILKFLDFLSKQPALTASFHTGDDKAYLIAAKRTQLHHKSKI